MLIGYMKWGWVWWLGSFGLTNVYEGATGLYCICRHFYKIHLFGPGNQMDQRGGFCRNVNIFGLIYLLID